MAEFLTTNGTSYHIENIILEAKKELYLVSPYLQLSKNFFDRLKDASDKGIKIKLIYGKDQLNPAEKAKLSELKNIDQYFCENLHAKCYFNEQTMVITSMNMYEYSEKNNREMGVLIKKDTDVNLYQKAYEETTSIIKSSQKVDLKPAAFTQKTIKPKRPVRGVCIRCHAEIRYNIQRPYCPECLRIWEAFSNPDYVEKFCHACGKPEDTSMYKPLCYECFMEYEANTF